MGRQRAFEERARARHVVIAAPHQDGSGCRRELQLASQGRDGFPLACFDRPAALVHGQSTVGTHPDGKKPKRMGVAAFRRSRRQSRHDLSAASQAMPQR